MEDQRPLGNYGFFLIGDQPIFQVDIFFRTIVQLHKIHSARQRIEQYLIDDDIEAVCLFGQYKRTFCFFPHIAGTITQTTDREGVKAPSQNFTIKICPNLMKLRHGQRHGFYGYFRFGKHLNHFHGLWRNLFAQVDEHGGIAHGADRDDLRRSEVSQLFAGSIGPAGCAARGIGRGGPVALPHAGKVCIHHLQRPAPVILVDASVPRIVIFHGKKDISRLIVQRHGLAAVIEGGPPGHFKRFAERRQIRQRGIPAKDDVLMALY